MAAKVDEVVVLSSPDVSPAKKKGRQYDGGKVGTPVTRRLSVDHSKVQNFV